jgi:hypothetical protein
MSQQLENRYSYYIGRTLDVLGGVGEVVKEGVIVPGYAGALVGGGVGVALTGTGGSANEAMESRSLLVASALHGSTVNDDVRNATAPNAKEDQSRTFSTVWHCAHFVLKISAQHSEGGAPV